MLFSGDADTAKSVLSSIASALITATSLTFSLTVVALQLASSQASPRLLRTFTTDPVVQTTLAVFLGTFAYALTVLRGIGAGSRLDPAADVVTASRGGFVTDVDRARLVAIAAREDLRIVELQRIGANVLDGLPLLAVEPEPDPDLREELRGCVMVDYD